MRYGSFDPNGLPQTVTDDRDGTWTYLYDAVGNVIAAIDPRGATGDTSGIEGRPFTRRIADSHEIEQSGMTLGGCCAEAW